MDYISWLIAFIAFIGLELVTMGLTSIWFGLGALVACIAAFSEHLRLFNFCYS